MAYLCNIRTKVTSITHQCFKQCAAKRTLYSQVDASNNRKIQKVERKSVRDGPSLQEFLSQAQRFAVSEHKILPEEIPYIDNRLIQVDNKKVFFETHGCQMNVNDTEIAWAILQKQGYKRTEQRELADVILMMTCAIREGAEKKIWNKLFNYRALKRKRWQQHRKNIKIGLLGCMAERLKTKILDEEKVVDLVCGPDAYRDLPRMLADIETGQTAVNVLLSLEETYADVMPVRLNPDSTSAFVSIMRGCDNMCSYCIVPFTRGRERSRPVQSIIDEVREISDQGIKEVTLLGQNVNSYCDRSTTTTERVKNSKGFKTVYKPKSSGIVFADLLDQVARINPELRIRFTSPHPKDFPDEVLQVIKSHNNICNQLHLPAQSGSNSVLDSMRRGHTVESYIQLMTHIRDIIPDMKFSSDFIVGFCGETEDDHKATIDLVRLADYTFVYCFQYSMRQKTHAYHRMKDDVSESVKNKRLEEVHDLFRERAEIINKQQIGDTQLILIEGESRRSSDYMCGRNEGNVKVIIPKVKVKDSDENTMRDIQKGDYLAVEITDASSQSFHATPVQHTTLQQFYNKPRS